MTMRTRSEIVDYVALELAKIEVESQQRAKGEPQLKLAEVRKRAKQVFEDGRHRRAAEQIVATTTGWAFLYHRKYWPWLPPLRVLRDKQEKNS
jgi:hypothetical protein